MKEFTIHSHHNDNWLQQFSFLCPIANMFTFPNTDITFLYFLPLGATPTCTSPSPDITKTQRQHLVQRLWVQIKYVLYYSHRPRCAGRRGLLCMYTKMQNAYHKTLSPAKWKYEAETCKWGWSAVSTQSGNFWKCPQLQVFFILTYDCSSKAIFCIYILHTF
jgi:hypothetical protein